MQVIIPTMDWEYFNKQRNQQYSSFLDGTMPKRPLKSLCPLPEACFHNMTCCMVLMKIIAIILFERKKEWKEGTVGGWEGRKK